MVFSPISGSKKTADSWISVGDGQLEYQPEALTSTTTFRLISKNFGSLNCGSVFSNELVIQVKAETLSGRIGADQRIALGAVPDPITSVAPGSGSGTITYTWEKSVDNGLTWSLIDGETGLNYAPLALNETTWFRRTAISEESSVLCTAVTDPVKIDMKSTGIANPESISQVLKAFAVRNVEIQLKGKVGRQAVATLYDIQGRVILVKNLEEGTLNIIPTPNIKTGIYLLSVQDNGNLNRFKIPVGE